MPNGNVVQYAKSNPEANRLRLVSPLSQFAVFSLSLVNEFQLSEVMSAVAYLHELNIIHGDLKGVSLTPLMRLSPR